MNEYTASNGYKITPVNDNVPPTWLKVHNRNPDPSRSERHSLGLFSVDALREFFRAEEDERLGRWRWPENQGYIVYPDPRYPHLVSVIDESTGLREVRSKSKAGHKRDNFERAVAAYFDAHPEPKPIPNEPRTAWVDKYGTDVWHVGTDGVLRCVLNPGSDPAKYAPFTRLVPEAS